MEIANKQANKGDMLVYISDLLGVRLAYVTVFSDQSNDLEMFAISGTKITVNNTHDELKKTSRHYYW